jgi:hypothetical protein
LDHGKIIDFGTIVDRVEAYIFNNNRVGRMEMKDGSRQTPPHGTANFMFAERAMPARGSNIFIDRDIWLPPPWVSLPIGEEAYTTDDCQKHKHAWPRRPSNRRIRSP